MSFNSGIIKGVSTKLKSDGISYNTSATASYTSNVSLEDSKNKAQEIANFMAKYKAESEIPQAKNKFYPLFLSQSDSNKHSTALSGNGTSHSHNLEDTTWYMPNGPSGTNYHGDSSKGNEPYFLEDTPVLISQVISQNSYFSKFYEKIKDLDIFQKVQNTWENSSMTNYTLLAPTNDAVENTDFSGESNLNSTFLNHLINGAVLSTGLTNNKTVSTLGDLSLVVSIESNIISFTGNNITGKLVKKDIDCVNGKIHVIDKIFLNISSSSESSSTGQSSSGESSSTGQSSSGESSSTGQSSSGESGSTGESSSGESGSTGESSSGESGSTGQSSSGESSSTGQSSSSESSSSGQSSSSESSSTGQSSSGESSSTGQSSSSTGQSSSGGYSSGY